MRIKAEQTGDTKVRMQAPKLDYVVNANGWIAGQNRKAGDIVPLSKKQAQYENVTLKSDTEAKVELVGSLDDPTVKANGLDAKAKAETKTRRRTTKADTAK